MKCIDISRIQEITEQELIYLNDSGERISIDLIACTRQYAQEYETTTGKPYPTVCRCIGNRWVLHYFELYSTPEHIRFALQIKPLNGWQKLVARMIGWNFYRKELNQFGRIRRKINEVGFTTFDMT